MRALESQSVSLALLDEIDGGIVVLDEQHQVRHWNAWMASFSGIAPDELVGRPLWDMLPALEGSRLQVAIADALVSRAPSVLSHTLHPLLFPLRCRDGRAMLHDVTVLPLALRTGMHCLVQVRDVTERRRMQTALLESRLRYRAAFDHAAIGIGELDLSGRFVRVNDRLCEILGRKRDEMLRFSFREVTHPDDLGESQDLFHRLVSGEIGSFSMEKKYLRNDGATVWASLTASLVLSSDGSAKGLIATVDDVTRRKQVEHEREQLLVQKELLMREAHHRVKNSLALANSLLSLQSGKVADPTAKEQLIVARQRIMAIARLHERLQRSADTEYVEVGAFLRGLCSDIEESVASGEVRHSVRTDILSETMLPVDRMMPLAIVVSELVTNAFRHARPDGGPTKVTVRCDASGDHGLVVRVADDGLGLPPDFDIARSSGLGMTILTRLCDQISAEIEVGRGGGGTEFVLRLRN